MGWVRGFGELGIWGWVGRVYGVGLLEDGIFREPALTVLGAYGVGLLGVRGFGELWIWGGVGRVYGVGLLEDGIFREPALTVLGFYGVGWFVGGWGCGGLW
jgi:hypothetical protein